MLRSLIRSAYVVYLHRKLHGESRQSAAAMVTTPTSNVEAEIDKLNRQLDSLEARLAVQHVREPSS